MNINIANTFGNFENCNNLMYIFNLFNSFNMNTSINIFSKVDNCYNLRYICSMFNINMKCNSKTFSLKTAKTRTLAKTTLASAKFTTATA